MGNMKFGDFEGAAEVFAQVDTGLTVHYRTMPVESLLGTAIAVMATDRDMLIFNRWNPVRKNIYLFADATVSLHPMTPENTVIYEAWQREQLRQQLAAELAATAWGTLPLEVLQSVKGNLDDSVIFYADMGEPGE